MDLSGPLSERGRPETRQGHRDPRLREYDEEGTRRKADRAEEDVDRTERMEKEGVTRAREKKRIKKAMLAGGQ